MSKREEDLSNLQTSKLSISTSGRMARRSWVCSMMQRYTLFLIGLTANWKNPQTPYSHSVLFLTLRKGHKKTCETNVTQVQFPFGLLIRKLNRSVNYLTESTDAESTTSAFAESQQTAESSQHEVESTAVESAAGAAALLSQDTNDTDAVRAIAATAAKTNFFIIFFFTLIC